MSFNKDLKPLLIHFNGPVTALAVCNNKILAGSGNEVSVYSLSSLVLETRRQILHGAAIHGFCQGSNSTDNIQPICVYGAKQACVVCVKADAESRTELSILSEVVNFPDWIWDAKFLNEKVTNGNIAFALAHNKAVEWNWIENVTKHQECQENCILYCAHFIGSKWNSLVLAAGTVFNQVVLWLVSSDQCNSDCQPAPVMHTLTGHQGVIFSIKYHAEHQHLCTVSDDRSIRLWQFEFPNGRTMEPCASDWKYMNSSLLLSLFGHSARVWDVVLMTDYFASIGEDATCCVWNYSGQVMTKFKGHKGKSIWSIVNTADEKSLLTGGGDGSIRLWTVSGGQDNATIQKDLDIASMGQLIDGDFPRTLTLIDFDRVLIMMNSGCLYMYTFSNDVLHCVFQDVRFISYSIVASSPDRLSICVGSISGLVKVLTVTSDIEDDDVESHLFDGKVLGIVWIDSNKLVLSGPQGMVYLMHLSTDDESQHRSKLQLVLDFCLFLPVCKHRWISAACMIDASINPQTKLLVCGDKDGTVYCYRLLPLPNINSDLTQPDQVFSKVHGKNGVTFICCKDDVVYSVGRDGCCRHWVIRDNQLVQLHGSKVMKGFDWIDRLEFHNGDIRFYGFFSSQFVVWSQLYNQKLLTVECGGGHRSWGCAMEEGAFRFVYLKGVMVNVVYSSKCHQHQILKPAFHGREVHDLSIQNITAKHCEHPNLLTFTASEDTTINVGLYHYVNGFMHWKPLTALKGHLSSVRALAISQDISSNVLEHMLSSTKHSHPQTEGKFDDDKMKHFILFSGGGRAEIRVWKVSVDNCNDSNVSEMPCGTMTVNGKGRQECVFEPITKLEHGDVLEMNSVQCMHREWSTHFLGESRHKRPFSKWKTRKLRLDPETRVMSLGVTCVSELNQFDTEVKDRRSDYLNHLYVLSAAGSDGLLRFLCYNEKSKCLSLMSQTDFHKGCVLKVIHFVLHSKDNKPVLLIFSTSTNGKIAVWSVDDLVSRTIDLEYSHSSLVGSESEADNGGKQKECDGHYQSESNGEIKTENTQDKCDEEIVPFCCLSAHQSGINSINICQVNDRCILLASGGDDNGLTLHYLHITDTHIEMQSVLSKPNAHATQITGLQFVSNSYLVSASIDQRVCVWRIITDRTKLQMEVVSCCYIHLADVSSLDVCLYKNQVYLNIGGEGICLYKWNEHGQVNHDLETITQVSTQHS